jgi:predicted CopG family antitoxin
MHRCMGTKTISLEDSAYVKLKAAKRPGESFSDVINRLLGNREPSLLDLRGLFDRRSVDQLVAAIARMREEDIEAQKLRPPIRR